MSMDELETTFRHGWYIRSALGASGDRFIAWCKREMFTGTDPMDETGDVYFEFGATRTLAIEGLLASLERC